MNTEYTAKLDAWSVDTGGYIKEGQMRIGGLITGDAKGRFEDGSYIHTSLVPAYDVKEGDIITTRNGSRYLLGTKARLH